jgi:NADH-quinone oxidoreductase subunit I
MRHFFRNIVGKKDVVTIQYPEEERPVSQRWRGRHRLTRRDDGFLKCVACYMCETVCPAKCIHIEAGEHPDFSVEKYPVRFDIDELRCVFCGLCVEACPKQAIRMDTGVIGMAYHSRESFNFTRDLLRDAYTPNEKTKYTDADLPKPPDQQSALPNSRGIPAP